MLKQAQGGLKACLQAMRFSTDVNVIAFLEKFDEISERDRKSLSWEAIALAADVQHTYLLGGIILALREFSANSVKLIALTSHPKVTEKTVEFAMLPGGEKDRHTLHTALGLLPTPKGSTFIINPTPGSRGEARDDAEDPDDERDGDLNHLFPGLTSTQEDLVPARARMLDSGDR